MYIFDNNMNLENVRIKTVKLHDMDGDALLGINPKVPFVKVV